MSPIEFIIDISKGATVLKNIALALLLASLLVSSTGCATTRDYVRNVVVTAVLRPPDMNPESAADDPFAFPVGRAAHPPTLNVHPVGGGAILEVQFRFGRSNRDKSSP